MGVILSIARCNARVILRDRAGAAFIFFVPAAITLLMGAVFADAQKPRVGLLSAAPEPVTRQLYERLDGPLDVAVYRSHREMARAVKLGTIAAGVVVPAGYGRPGSPDTEFLVDRGRPYPAGERVMVMAALRGEAPAAGAGELALPTVAGLEFAVPANLMLFTFVNALGGSAGLIFTRRTGVSQRMLLAPASSSVVLAGEALGRVAVSAIQALVVLVVGALAGIHWGDVRVVALTVVLFVLISAGVALIFGVVLRTEGQAQALGPPLGITLAMLGGCLWPIAVAPKVLQALGQLVPHAWAMDAVLGAIGGRASRAVIAQDLVVLALFAVATWVVATALARTRLAR